MKDLTVNNLTSRIIKTEKIKWKDLCFIQQENFKEWIDNGDEKLLNSLLKYCFVDPFKVWFDGEKMWCLDGYHRYCDLLEVEKSGLVVPDLLDATFIDCTDIKQAAELVLVYSSIYAKLTQQGLYDFISNYDLDLSTLKDTIEIPDFSIDRFEQKFDIFGVGDAEEPEVLLSELMFVKRGDLFEINGHRIICGSFTESADVDALMQGDKARIVNCDPPYNLPTNFFSDQKQHKDFAMGAGEMSDDEFVQFLALIMQRSVDNTLPGAIHYIFMDFRHCWHMTEASRRTYGRTEPKQICVWVKDNMANGSFYRAQQELCFVFQNGNEKHQWQNDIVDNGGFYKDDNELCFIFKNGGDDDKHLSHLALENRIRTNVWRYPSASSTANPDRYQLKNHPTPKPVVMIADAILDTTDEKDIVIDWFLGSGTCLIACEHTNRLGRFTEIEPKYVQSSIQRYINYCGKRGIEVRFAHSNGNLTLADFINEPKTPTADGTN